MLGSAAAPAAPEKENPRHVKVGERVMGGYLIHRVEPQYPQFARKSRVQGVVVMTAEIGVKGHVRKVEVVEGNPLLSQAAIEAVMQWRYKPYLVHGEPAVVETVIRVRVHPPS